ncbi:ankyrin repeat and MYND domain-containing protein 2 isoform X2 [Prionailurus bengalensis]|uniref:ankyrin repeat and MYND domain-containing protein 2 isoform X2 n=1 Tax=Prionailurus bengalensis TaxID=37029 RepID=UPI001CAA3EC2|nr:ankyrin repeat and MYND domain-containing protein 2 isoform X2 [Prionailurus bengalensis]
MVHITKGELTQEEKELLEVIGKGTVQEAGTLLASKNVRVNCLDENGMTPLMHAAYKGKLDMCRLLLRHGADVNCHQHEHGYTALMFAALSGNKDITWVMLEAGAETDVVNSVGRTAAQMAAFVGQHDCVTIINNFFPRERLDYYTKPQGLDKEPKLPPKLAGPLHKIITTTNLHPVKIVMLINENPLLAEETALNKCYKVMDLICEKCMKQRDMNEVLAMKMHYISCIFQKCINFLKDGENKLDTLIKSLLKGRASDGFPVYQEKIIRESIRKFPYCEATLLQQLVRSIAPVEIVIYCDQTCQKTHWFAHKKICKNLKDIYEKQQLEAAKEKSAEENNGKLDVNSNCVNEEQPEAETGTSREDCNPKESVEGEEECPQSEAGLEGLQDAPAGPQASEE